jgi:hypothetical protein
MKIHLQGGRLRTRSATVSTRLSEVQIRVIMLSWRALTTHILDIDSSCLWRLIDPTQPSVSGTPRLVPNVVRLQGGFKDTLYKDVTTRSLHSGDVGRRRPRSGSLRKRFEQPQGAVDIVGRVVNVRRDPQPTPT